MGWQTLDLEGFKERVRCHALPSDQRFEIQEFLADGNAVAITWFWTGTHLAICPASATGRPIKMSGATVYYFEGSASPDTGKYRSPGSVQQLRQASTD